MNKTKLNLHWLSLILYIYVAVDGPVNILQLIMCLSAEVEIGTGALLGTMPSHSLSTLYTSGYSGYQYNRGTQPLCSGLVFVHGAFVTSPWDFSVISTSHFPP